jgi:hypothetical protein
MCGVFGYVSFDKRGPDLDILRTVALATESRGLDAHGLCWMTPAGKLKYYKAPGPIGQHLNCLDLLKGATAVIGHTRWATHGDHQDNRNNHPHPVGLGMLVHNGVISNYADLINRHQLPAATDCDSEVLGLMYQHHHTVGSTLSRMARTVKDCQHGGLVTLALWPDRYVVARLAGNPLHLSRYHGGMYLASLATGLPGTPRAVRDDRIFEFRLRQNKKWKMGTSRRLTQQPAAWRGLARRYGADDGLPLWSKQDADRWSDDTGPEPETEVQDIGHYLTETELAAMEADYQHQAAPEPLRAATRPASPPAPIRPAEGQPEAGKVVSPAVLPAPYRRTRPAPPVLTPEQKAAGRRALQLELERFTVLMQGGMEGAL